jgi:uncharacterized protein
VEGDRCYRNLAAIPGGVQGVVIATNAADSESVVHECMELGIQRIWIHRLFGSGSESPAAVGLARAHGITTIVGGCPLMFGPASDRGHVCLRWLQGLTRGRPAVVGGD